MQKSWVCPAWPSWAAQPADLGASGHLQPCLMSQQLTSQCPPAGPSAATISVILSDKHTMTAVLGTREEGRSRTLRVL